MAAHTAADPVAPGRLFPLVGHSRADREARRDTVKKNDNHVVNVRVYGVDCPLPESGQFFGKQAFAYTSDRVKGKVVLVQPLPV